MPCGGIYPKTKSDKVEPCWQCGTVGCDLWLIEWDSVLHSGCVEAFLKTEEGRIVLEHQHDVWIKQNGVLLPLYETRRCVSCHADKYIAGSTSLCDSCFQRYAIKG